MASSPGFLKSRVKFVIMAVLPLALWLCLAHQWAWRPHFLRQAFGPINGLRPTAPPVLWDNSLLFSADGKLLADASFYSRGIELWDISDVPNAFRTGNHDCFSLAFSPDGKTLAGAEFNGPIRLYDTQTRKLQQVLDTSNNDATNIIAFAPDGKSLASVSSTWDKALKMTVWDVKTGRATRVIPLKAAGVETMILLSDSLCTIRHDRTITFWDTRTGHLQKAAVKAPLPALTSAGNFILSSDAQMAAWCSPRGTVTLWSLQTGKLRQLPQGSSAGMNHLVFSPDGTMLGGISGEMFTNNTVRVWDVATGQLLSTLRDSHNPFFKSMAFAPDGYTLATRSSEGAVALWRIK